MKKVLKSYSYYFILPVLITILNAATSGVKDETVTYPDQDICKVIFAAMVIPGQNEIESVIWARSLREFGGRFSDSPLWVFVPENSVGLKMQTWAALQELDVEMQSFHLDENATSFPLAGKPYAAAEAERLASGKCTFLAWIDADNIFINEPADFILPDGISLGYRSVHHINIGSRFDEPLNTFWSMVYNDCSVSPDHLFRMRPNVEDIDIRPYFNAGHMVVRPERGLLSRWCSNFERLYLAETYEKLYAHNMAYQVFVHQAVLSATILSYLERSEITELPVSYNYPLNLYSEIPEWKRVIRLNDLVTARYDLFADFQHWIALIEIDEPLKSWINDQFRLKGVNVLVLLDDKYGANNFLNRDLFEQYGWNVTVAGLRDSIEGCDFFSEAYGIPPVNPDIMFDRIRNIDYFKGLAIMPASSYYQEDPFSALMDNEKAMELIREAVKMNIPVSTICSGARVLAAADVIRGKRITGQPSFIKEYEDAGALYLGKDIPPTIQGNIMTGSRDQYYNYLVAMGMATMVEDKGERGRHDDVSKGDYIVSSRVRLPGDNISWTRVIGGAGAEGANSVSATSDGGFIITGYTFSHGTGDADMLLVKTDSLGNLEWSGIYGGKGTEYGYNSLVLDDGYLCAGYTTSFGKGSKDVYLVRTDLKGNEIWSGSYGGKSWDIGYSLCMADDGYLVCGLTHSSGRGEEDIFLIKINPDGKELWTKTYGGERYDIGSSIFPAGDGKYIIGATTGTYGRGNSDLYLLKIDGEGNELWTKSIGGQMNSILPEASPTPTDWCQQVKRTSDNGFILAGYTNAKDIMNALIIKTDPEGNIEWGQNLGNSSFYDYGYSVAEDARGDFYISGASKSVSLDNDIFIAKLSSSGNIIYQGITGTPHGSERGNAIFITESGEIVVAGHTNSVSHGSYDILLIEKRQ